MEQGKRGTVVYAGGFELPDRNAAAHRVLNNAKALRLLGFHVVFCGIDKTMSAGEKKQENICSFDSFPSKYPMTTAEWIKDYKSIEHIKSVICQYPDTKIVIAYNMHALQLFLLIRYCKKHAIKIIADATEWYETGLSFSPLALIKNIDTAVVMRLIQKRVDAMICISRFLSDYYEKSVRNIIIIPPLVDVSDVIWRSDGRPIGEKLTFIYSGTSSRRKDRIGQVVRCFSSLSTQANYRFVVIGIQRDEFCMMFPEERDNLQKLGEHVAFLGRVCHAESIQHLLSADCLIFIRERTRKNMAGFPTKFVEGVTSGINIISTDVSDIKAYFPKKNGSFLLADCSDDAIIQAITQELSCDIVGKSISDEFDYRSFTAPLSDFIDRLFKDGTGQ